MKFTCAVNIDLPQDRVVELLDDPENLQHWQDGFQKFEHISGEPGAPGSKHRLLYINRGKELELIETLKVRNWPDEMTATYWHQHMTNTMSSRIIKVDNNRSRWEADFDYFELRGFMIKVMIKLFPGMFRKQAQKWLDNFKVFAEKQGPAQA